MEEVISGVGGRAVEERCVGDGCGMDLVVKVSTIVRIGLGTKVNKSTSLF
jgi:hypothetical protein